MWTFSWCTWKVVQGWRTAEQRLVQALAQIGRSDTPVTLVQVDSTADAEAAGFAGSPTILVDGPRTCSRSTPLRWG